MRRLPLSSLQAFEAAARTGSFRAAGEELGISPSAISHAIRKLEDLMGATLFAVNKGYMDDIEVKQVLPFEHGLHAFLKDKHAALLQKMEGGKALDKDKEAEDELTSAIEAFKKSFA